MQQPPKPKQPPKIQNPFEQAFEKRAQQRTEVRPSVPQQAVEVPRPQNVTSLNFEKLNKAYANQDQSSLDAVRGELPPEAQQDLLKAQFHKRFKREEEEYYFKRKREEEEKRQQEEVVKQEQLKRAQEQSHQPEETPKGKVKKNIFGKSKRKADLVLPAEVKPGGGKQ